MVSLSTTNHEGVRTPCGASSHLPAGSAPLARLLQQRHRLDMRRPQELVDRRDACHPIAALDEDRRSRANVAGLQDTAATNGMSERAICFDWSSAPARGGSNTSPSKASAPWPSGGGGRGRGFPTSPASGRWRSGRPRSSAASEAASPSTACTSRRSRQPQRKAAAAGKEVGDLLGARRDDAPTRSAIACSAETVACRKAPGGSATAMPPNMTTGFLGSTMMSPSIESRAKPCARTKSAAARRCASAEPADILDCNVQPGGGGGDSHPESVGRCGRAKPASSLSPPSAATISGNAIGHSLISTIVWERARL